MSQFVIMARITMLTLSDKLCTIANGNRSGHDLIVLNYLLKPILFIVTTECIGGASEKSTTKKKSANQFGVKPLRKCLKRARSTF